MAKLNINGMVRDVPVEADTPLLWVIREQIGLTGTKYGCGIAQCGACSVHINDEEFFKCPPETIGHFVLRMPKIGTRRLAANSQRPRHWRAFLRVSGTFL